MLKKIISYQTPRGRLQRVFRPFFSRLAARRPHPRTKESAAEVCRQSDLARKLIWFSRVYFDTFLVILSQLPPQSVCALFSTCKALHQFLDMSPENAKQLAMRHFSSQNNPMALSKFWFASEYNLNLLTTLKIIKLMENYSKTVNPLHVDYVKIEHFSNIIQRYPTLTIPQLQLRLWIEVACQQDSDLDALRSFANNPWYSEYTFSTVEEDIVYWLESPVVQRMHRRSMVFSIVEAQLEVNPNRRATIEAKSTFFDTAKRLAEQFPLKIPERFRFLSKLINACGEIQINGQSYIDIINLFAGYIDQSDLLRRLMERLNHLYEVAPTSFPDSKDLSKLLVCWMLDDSVSIFVSQLKRLRLTHVDWLAAWEQLPHRFPLDARWWILWMFMYEPAKKDFKPNEMQFILKHLLEWPGSLDWYVQLNLFLKFTELFRYQMPPKLLTELMHRILSKTYEWKYKIRQLHILLLCEDAVKTLKWGDIDWIRDHLLTEKCGDDLVKLYDWILVNKRADYSILEKLKIIPTEINAILMSPLDEKDAVNALNRLALFNSAEPIEMQLILAKLIQDNPLQKKFFSSFVDIFKNSIKPDDLQFAVLNIYQTRYHPEYKLQLLKVFMKTCIRTWSQIQWRSILRVRESLLNMESSEAVAALEQLYDLVFANSALYSESEKEMNFRYELQAIFASKLNNQDQLRLIGKLTLLEQSKIGIEVILEKGLSKDPLREAFFLEFAALFRYTFPPNELSSIIYHILLGEGSIQYKLQLLNTIIDHCEKQYGHISPKILLLIREKLLNVEGPYLQQAATILKYLYNLTFEFVEVGASCEHAKAEFQAVKQSGLSLKWKLRLVRPISPWFKDGFGMQFIVDRLMKPDPLTDEEERFFLEFAGFLNYQIPSEELCRHLNSLLHTPHNAKYIRYLVRELLAHCEQVSGDLDWSRFSSIRQSLLMSQSVSILQRLYALVLLKQHPEMPTLRAELHAIMAVPTLSHDAKLEFMNRIASLFQDQADFRRCVVEEFVKIIPLTDAHQSFFQKLVIFPSRSVTPMALSHHMNTILQSPQPLKDKLQLLKALVEFVHQMGPVKDSDWPHFLSIREYLLEVPCPESALILEILYDSVLLKNQCTPDLAPMFQAELRAVMLSQLDNPWKLKMAQKMRSLFRVGMGIDGVVGIQIMADRFTQPDLLTAEEKRFFLDFAAGVDYRIKADALNLYIRRILKAPQDKIYLFPLLSALMEHCKMVFGDLDWKDFVDIRQELLKSPDEENLRILYRLYALVLIPQKKIQDPYVSEIETLAQSELQALVALNASNNDKLHLIRKIAPLVPYTVRIQIITQRLIDADPLKSPLTEEEKSFYLTFATFLKYQMSAEELNHLIRCILKSHPDIKYKLQILKVLIEGCQAVWGNSNWAHFIDIRQKLVQYKFPEGADILEYLYRQILANDSSKDPEKESILRSEWQAVVALEINNDQRLKIAQALKLSFKSSFWLHVILESVFHTNPLTDEQGEFWIKCVSLSKYTLHGNRLVRHIRDLLFSPQHPEFNLKLLSVIMICCKEIVYFDSENTKFFVEIREKLLHLDMSSEKISILERLYELFLNFLPYPQIFKELHAILLTWCLNDTFRMHLTKKIMTLRPVSLKSAFLEKIRADIWATIHISREEWNEIEQYLYSYLLPRTEKISYLCGARSENRYQLLDKLFTQEHPTMTSGELTSFIQKIQQDPLSSKNPTAAELLKKISTQLETKKRYLDTMNCPPHIREKMTVFDDSPGLCFSVGN